MAAIIRLPLIASRPISISKEKRTGPSRVISSATAKKSEMPGDTGVKMSGPYDYVPPDYWLLDTKAGGAYGFNTETSPGPAVPPLEELQTFIPEDKLWPISDAWNFHAGGSEFKNIDLFTHALEMRYGKARDVADYAWKSQAMTYEGQRAMFEAYGRNKYKSTGIIQWMLNNAWPSLIWHLYSYDLRPRLAITVQKLHSSRFTCNFPTTIAPWQSSTARRIRRVD